ncbi:MAG: hypothetical protein MRY83_16915 [Flavobacteriales bacterium]|nr:hypothetical protein [Flavobacteriales bacterium]
MKNQIDEINTFLSNNNWMDFRVKSFANDSLILLGSTDFYYQHDIKIVFEGVSSLSLRTEWVSSPDKPVFSLIEGSESFDLIRDFEIENINTIIGIKADDIAKKFFIACQNLQIDTSTVIYDT